MEFLDKAKDAAGKAMDKVDDLVEENAEEIPDSVEAHHHKSTDTAEEFVPGEQPKDTPKHEQVSTGN